jgi:hypothetical protein
MASVPVSQRTKWLAHGRELVNKRKELVKLTVKMSAENAKSACNFFWFRWPNGEWMTDCPSAVSEREYWECDRYLVFAPNKKSAKNKAQAHWRSHSNIRSF